MDNIILNDNLYFYIDSRDKFYDIIEDLLYDFKVSKSQFNSDKPMVVIENGLFNNRGYYTIEFKYHYNNIEYMCDLIFITINYYTKDDIITLAQTEILRLNNIIDENIQ